ncbi:hypothetical protein MPTK1_4g00370 [Marchantia polymorpha subsp. ruderalis]|uniref:Uncharacterized protein n=2 Tax=Marchantia polymorpha TaxID=3197 RepID=A0AAF6B4U7_MARPO|nr:hypothetical protein MARPO_0066s0104 [Marchantia polymorpha]BBN07031.1 hypothetical protein Mp_4g00370 [Marchantia polymorpha subsp. ruderalis]|eukprot:PTQ36153.1 hypothetical protein MARPO_0066s0104 [Marchantia polymorpha]
MDSRLLAPKLSHKSRTQRIPWSGLAAAGAAGSRSDARPLAQGRLFASPSQDSVAASGARTNSVWRSSRPCVLIRFGVLSPRDLKSRRRKHQWKQSQGEGWDEGEMSKI